MQIILSTNCVNLTSSITKIAAEYNAAICCPDNLLDMLFSNAAVLVIDPDAIRRDIWEAYLDYQQMNARNDNTPLILLLPKSWSVRVKTPCELNDKPQNSLYHCYVDDAESIQALVMNAIACTAIA